MSAPDVRQISVRGNASAEEIAAVIAAVTRRHDIAAVTRRRDAEPSGYEQWRRRRITALRATRD